MKLSIWDILSIVMIVSTLGLCGVYGLIMVDDSSSLNPFPPPTLLPTLFIPSDTPAPTERVNTMPPTWTATQEEQNAGAPTRRPSSTPIPTFTAFVMPTVTPSPTFTNTPTITPTLTSTPTITLYPTATLVPSATLPPTATP